MADDDIIEEAKAAFERCDENESDNRENALADLKFGRMGEQWEEVDKEQRRQEGRPSLTVNKCIQFIRQIVNDARLNKPSIKVHPVDDKGDPETAEILNGIIRNIEVQSKADIAYDTAIDSAVSNGFGYFRIDIEYARDDSFEQDIVINRIANPFTVYGDPASTAADSSDWNVAFVTEIMRKDLFEAEYPDAEAVDWEALRADDNTRLWFESDGVRLAEYWVRDEVTRTLLRLSSGEVMYEDDFAPNQEFFAQAGITVEADRQVPSHKVVQHLITGAEVLETTEWVGRYIPIVPVYGDEVNVEGRRYFQSLIHFAKDSQRMYNYWRPLDLGTPVPTPDGWSTIGAIEVGDEVYGDDGKPCAVVGKSPVHINRDCYEITFDDGTAIVSDGEHPWTVEERGPRKAASYEWTVKDVTTADLEPGKHFIEVPHPIHGSILQADLQVDPYLLGYWLGDGATHAGRFCAQESDLPNIVAEVERAGYAVDTVTRSNDKVPQFVAKGLHADLRAAGVLDRKYIPAEYLRASVEARWALLQGLMDSDGSISQTNICHFSNTNEDIASSFGELLASLGIKAKMVAREGRASRVVNAANGFKVSYEFSFTALSTDPVFRLARKADKLRGKQDHWRRTKRFGIKAIKAVASRPVQCLAIDNASHLFLVGKNMVPTHNTAATELVALAPKAPFIGPEGAFDDDPRWATANTQSHAYLEYSGQIPPQRQPFAGVPAGALQEAMNASDDMKNTMGLYDASLGARSNETSGVAIKARQREGDISTFHFQDNMTRAIRHGGLIVLDLIPHVYSEPRIMRIMGEDETPENVPINQPIPQMQQGQPQLDEQGQPVTKAYDLTVGKYDVTVKAGPSFTTRREEAANQMIEMVRAFPQAAPIMGDILADSLDWPRADEIAKRLKTLLPPNLQGEEDGPDPQVLAMQQQMQEGLKAYQQMGQELEALKASKAIEAEKLKIDQMKAQADVAKVDIEKFKAETDRFAAEAEARKDVAEAKQRELETLATLNQPPDHTLVQPI